MEDNPIKNKVLTRDQWVQVQKALKRDLKEPEESCRLAAELEHQGRKSLRVRRLSKEERCHLRKGLVDRVEDLYEEAEEVKAKYSDPEDDAETDSTVSHRNKLDAVASRLIRAEVVYVKEEEE